jgi:hypothetical protein
MQHPAALSLVRGAGNPRLRRMSAGRDRANPIHTEEVSAVRIHVGNIVNQMSPEVRKQAEDEAAAKGLSLERFVEDQLAVQLSDQEMEIGALGIRFDRWDVRADARGGGEIRGGVGIGGRF